MAAQAVAHGAVGHARAGPGAPGHRGRRQAPAAPRRGEAVQVGVGRRVRALAAAAPGGRDGGEQHEGVQRAAFEQGVQVGRAARLGRRPPGQFLRRAVHQRGVRGESRGVHHGPYGVALLVQPLQDPFQRGAVGDVAGQYGAPGAERRQGVDQCVGTGGLGAAPAEQDEVFRAALREPARHLGAEAPGAAGDEDRAARRPRCGRGCLGLRRGDEPAARPAPRTARPARARPAAPAGRPGRPSAAGAPVPPPGPGPTPGPVRGGPPPCRRPPPRHGWRTTGVRRCRSRPGLGAAAWSRSGRRRASAGPGGAPRPGPAATGRPSGHRTPEAAGPVRCVRRWPRPGSRPRRRRGRRGPVRRRARCPRRRGRPG